MEGARSRSAATIISAERSSNVTDGMDSFTLSHHFLRSHPCFRRKRVSMLPLTPACLLAPARPRASTANGGPDRSSASSLSQTVEENDLQL